MPAANHRRARKSILVLLGCGIALSFAGHKYQERQRSNQITWQHVSDTLQDVEEAKRDLFKSLNIKATNG